MRHSSDSLSPLSKTTIVSESAGTNVNYRRSSSLNISPTDPQKQQQQQPLSINNTANTTIELDDANNDDDSEHSELSSTESTSEATASEHENSNQIVRKGSISSTQIPLSMIDDNVNSGCDSSTGIPQHQTTLQLRLHNNKRNVRQDALMEDLDDIINSPKFKTDSGEWEGSTATANSTNDTNGTMDELNNSVEDKSNERYIHQYTFITTHDLVRPENFCRIIQFIITIATHLKSNKYDNERRRRTD